MFENFFKLKEHNTDVKTEVISGVTTFLSMCYILAVNPSILSAAGMDPGGVFTATAVSATIATLIMAFLTNYPIALASGMGLNAYFSYSVCIPLAEAGIDNPWQIALTAVLVEGIAFVLLTLCKFREDLVNRIPTNLKHGITAGIGMFIALVGMIGAGIVTKNDATVVGLGDLSSPAVTLAILGILIIVILQHYNVVGSVLWGIVITWGFGMIAQVTGWYQVNPEAGVFNLFPDFSGGIMPHAPTMFSFDFSYVSTNFLDFLIIVFSFLFVDLFDTAGTLIGITNKANLLDENGDLPKVKGALMSDALGTIAGACLGTSTVTTYVESSTGVANGGRTGLTAVTTAILFLASLLLSPIFLAIPAFATTPALVYVGFLMISSIKEIDFENDITGAVAGFFALIMMPFSYSIANGIMFGMLSYVIIKIFQKEIKDIHPVMWISAGIFAVRIITLII